MLLALPWRQDPLTYLLARESLPRKNTMTNYTWKNKPWGVDKIPDDALLPSCEVFLQMSATGPAVRDSDVTEMHDWFYVVKYQAIIPTRGNPFLFPEADEIRGTDNDYESAEEQLKDTQVYGDVPWVFILFVIIFFGGCL
jgi:hypothetical protein